jgi:hypothetical protein
VVITCMKYRYLLSIYLLKKISQSQHSSCNRIFFLYKRNMKGILINFQKIRLILSTLSFIFSTFACGTDNQTIDNISRVLWIANKIIAALPPPKKGGGGKRNKKQ